MIFAAQDPLDDRHHVGRHGECAARRRTVRLDPGAVLLVAGAAMNGLSKRDRWVLALFAFVTLGTALVILNWIMGWY